jgi:NADH-quinone oxidoreductase subunit H
VSGLSTESESVLMDSDVLRIVWSVVLIAGFVFANATVMGYLERKLAGHFQRRLGPMEVGWQGILQMPVDGIKLLAKRMIVPRQAEGLIFRLAPVISLSPVLLPLIVIPFSPALQVVDMQVGLIFVLAIEAFGTIAVFLAGWSANNKYAMIGAMRSVAQNIAYEIPILLVALAVALMADSFSLQEIVLTQAALWFIVLQPFGFLIYMISGLSECNRAPFDLPEAESELTAGYLTEYSGIGFSLFMIAEYTHMFIICCLATVLFLGGWQGPELPWHDYSSAIWFLMKAYALMFVMVWARWTFPRVRYDQLMKFAWKYLIPFALVNLLITALVVYL